MNEVALPVVALSTGDPAGIGPELCMKAALSSDVTNICRPVIYSDQEVLLDHADSCGIDIQLDGYKTVADINWSSTDVKFIKLDLFGRSKCSIGEINGENGRASIECGVAAIKAAIDGDVQAIVAAPQTEASIHLAGIEFDGYPSFVARQTGMKAEDVYLMVCFDKFRIAHCTLHSSVRQSLELITKERVGNVIGAVNETLIRIGIDRPRILVAGLNPHASEGGLFGSEENDIIEPAIALKQAEGINVGGPMAADLMLHAEGYDAFVVMLHDHGHIPAKLLAKHRTAGLSIGSSILFSSVAHGSAHDIAGKGIAEPTAMIEAIRRLVG
jgi:4-hydroxy-L-threonine phosphate dehydrogenase PdxA